MDINNRTKSHSRTFIWTCIILAMVAVNFSFAYTSFEVKRRTHDEFKNPTVTRCDWKPESQTFCKEKKGNCIGGNKKCCACHCDNYSSSTFDMTRLECRKNDDFRSGCDLFFEKVYAGQPIKTLNLRKEGEVRIAWEGGLSRQDSVRCSIAGMVFFDTGKSVGNIFLSVDEIVNEGYRRLIKIEWDEEDVPQVCHGKILKATMSCDIRKSSSTTKLTRCFVFKASGTLTAYRHPKVVSSTRAGRQQTISPTSLLKSIVIHSSTAVKNEQTSSPSLSSSSSSSSLVAPKKPSSSSIKPSPTVSVYIHNTVPPTEHATKPSVLVSSEGPRTTDDNLSTTSSKPSNGLNSQNQNSDKGSSNTVMISSVSIVAVLLLLVLVLVIVLVRRKSESSQKNGNTRGIANQGARITNNEIMMDNVHDNIYAEADVKIPNSHGKGDPHAYDYATGNYTSLSKRDPEEQSKYQALTGGTAKNMYECIPVQKNTGMNNPTPISEPIYHTVDGLALDDGSNYASANYEVPNDTVPGNKHDEQVYSVLEDDVAASGRPPRNTDNNSKIPQTTARNQEDDRVYSVLEAGQEEDEYLVVLPSESPAKPNVL